ncbi:MAG: hypothetical protein HQK53_19310, partial [Oligoflexia bacterium]|nr:hypothetical protein [Oligoflexia bacterium]
MNCKKKIEFISKNKNQLIILLLLILIFDSKNSWALFLTSPAIQDQKNQIQARCLQMVASSMTTENQQNLDYDSWRRDLVALKGIMFQTSNESTCAIHVRVENATNNYIHLIPRLVDSDGNTNEDINGLQFTVYKQEVSRATIPGAGIFLYRNGQRHDYSQYYHITYKVPQFNDILDEQIGPAHASDLYANTVDENIIVPDQQITETTALKIRPVDVDVDQLFQIPPREFYLERTSAPEIQKPTDNVCFENSSCHLVNHRGGVNLVATAGNCTLAAGSKICSAAEVQVSASENVVREGRMTEGNRALVSQIQSGAEGVHIEAGGQYRDTAGVPTSA